MATSSFITVLTKKNLAVSHWYFAHMRDKDTKCLTTTTVLNAFEFCYQLNHNMTMRCSSSIRTFDEHIGLFKLRQNAFFNFY